MSISSIGGSTAAYTNIANNSASAKAAAKDAAAPAPADDQPASTIVTLSNGQTSKVVEGDVNSLIATPLTIAWAPETFVQGDTDRNQSLNATEFATQLKRVGVSAETAQKLFASFDTSKDGTLSIDEFVQGVKANYASGDTLFTKLVDSYTTDASGKVDDAATDRFLSQGLAVANQYAITSGERRR
ncbi:EF-hand domain-containing protein [Rugamonas sp.]|uniref:EF-hand domain-containing protein n=1 Tax=Rugamonas sp. TaxID=1926287 RepID=UPI0025FF495D|nr:EF-hand domain-containing protein [Rugamonas sp.]